MRRVCVGVIILWFGVESFHFCARTLRVQGTLRYRVWKRMWGFYARELHYSCGFGHMMHV